MAYVFDREVEALAEVWEKLKDFEPAVLDRMLGYIKSRHAEEHAASQDAPASNVARAA